MEFKNIELENIDFSDETFRISENLELAPLFESLREVGQLNPVILLERNSRYITVCGFRRLHALLRTGAVSALARIVPGKNSSPAELFRLALWDNLSHRELDPLEKARILFKLKNAFGMAEEEIVRVYLPLLGLASHERILRGYIRLNEIHPELRICLVDGRMTLSSLEAIAQWQRNAQNRMAALMSRIRLSASLQRKLFDVMEDLDGMAGAHSGAALENPEIDAIVEEAQLSPFQKGEKVYEFLYRKRNPNLTRATEKFLNQKKALDLPGSIKISTDPFFENPGMRIEFEAADIDRFRRLAAALHAAAQSVAMEDLFNGTWL
jgi:ParB-like chromosome segregation protein Spo0J